MEITIFQVDTASFIAFIASVFEQFADPGFLNKLQDVPRSPS